MNEDRDQRINPASINIVAYPIVLPTVSKTLDSYSTKELVEELESREGVETHAIEPYERYEVCGEGPAVILTIID